MVSRFLDQVRSQSVLPIWCCTLAVCLCFVAVSSADAQPVLTTTGDPPVATQEMAERYAQQEGDSASDALRRMEIQERAHGIVEELQQDLGPRYAGAWIDPATGAVQVGLLNAGDKATVEGVLATRGFSSSNAIVTVASSLKELEAAQYTIAQQLPADVARTSIDERENRVVVTLAPVATSADHAIAEQLSAEFAAGREAIGPPLPPANPTPLATSEAPPITPQAAQETTTDVQVVTGPERHFHADSCGAENCGLPLRAGVRIDSENVSCSAGFVSTWWSGTETVFFLMDAGHCVYYGPPTSEWEAADHNNSNTWHKIGAHWAWRFGNAGGEPSWEDGLTIDASEINMSYADFWTDVLANGPLFMKGWPTGVEWELNNTARPMEGEYGCRSGAASNYSCGTIGSTNTSVVYEESGEKIEVTKLMEVSGTCSKKGDSGGPFVNGGTALALLSGGAEDPCLTVYTPAAVITEWFGITPYV